MFLLISLVFTPTLEIPVLPNGLELLILANHLNCLATTFPELLISPIMEVFTTRQTG